MKKLLVLITSLITASTLCFSQAGLVWEKSYGSSDYERGYAIVNTADGGMVISAFALTNDGDVHGVHTGFGEPDAWVLKLDANGDTVWTKALGGSREEFASAIIETPDSGFIVASQSSSTNGDVWDHHGDKWHNDFWLVKLDDAGDTLWTKSYGGTDDDNPYGIDLSTNGNFIIGGSSYSIDGDVWDHHDTTTTFSSHTDFWIIKINSLGDTIWTRSFGGTGSDYLEGIRATPDGGCVAVGWTYSTDDDVTNHHGWVDGWVIKVDSAGNLEWERAMGGTSRDYTMSVDLTNDGNYIIGGTSESQDGDVWDNHGWYDFWVVKMDTLGDTLWTRSYGGTRDDFLWSIKQTCDGGYIITGSSDSNDGDVSGHQGSIDSIDAWIVKIDEIGNIDWEQSFGSTRLDMFYAIEETNDGHYIATGYSNGTDGDLTSNNGRYDTWTIKMRSNQDKPQICVVTVDTFTYSMNEIIWTKPSPAMGIASYNIYRDIIGTYTFIGNVPFDSLSMFQDTTNNINPNITSYRYKITSVDSCGNESDTSDFHETIHLQTSINGLTIDLLWDNYEGFGFTLYNIMRDSTVLENWEQIDQVTNNNFTYSDINPPQTNTLRYRVDVRMSTICVATKTKNYNSSKSNTSAISLGAPLSATTSTTNATQSICDGTATVIVSGGTPPYTYLWDDPMAQTSITATGLCPDTFAVTVIDALGGSLNASAIVIESVGTLSLNVSSTSADFGLCNGTSTVVASGGTPPYSYLWNDPMAQTSITATGLCPDTFVVIVIDALGDSISASVMVIESPGPLSLSVSSTAADFGICNGTATVITAGGTPPYSYLWDASTGFQATPTAVGLCPGTYSVTVTDSLGNSQSITVTVNELTGIAEEQGLNKILIYPNPGSGIVVIEIKSDKYFDNFLQVFDVLGKQLTAQTINADKTSIDLSGEGPGIYILKLMSNEKVVIRKIIIE